MNSLIASFSLPRVFAVAIAFGVWTGAAYLWKKNQKPYAALVILGSVSLGMLVSPVWTLATLITCTLVFAASFVKTTRATIATALALFGMFTVFVYFIGKESMW